MTSSSAPQRIRLGDGEAIVLVAHPDSRKWTILPVIMTLGFYALWRRRTYIAVTTQRLIQRTG
jgi:hypothetical protein